MIRDEEIVRDKLNFYREMDESVHLVLKNNFVNIERPFRNGKTKEIKEESIVFEDERLGIILIYLKEIVSVDKREEKR